MKHPPFFALLFLLISSTVQGQDQGLSKLTIDTNLLVFKDTLHNLVFDSTTHHLGMIQPTNEGTKLVKYFKYIGTDVELIMKAWTSDPHYICVYPKKPLIPNKIYSFTICFWHSGKRGKMNKEMGFNLLDNNKITLRFTGEYLPIEQNED